MKFVEIKGMTGGESVKPLLIDPEVLKRGEQMGVVSPVVHALTYEDWMIIATKYHKMYIQLEYTSSRIQTL